MATTDIERESITEQALENDILSDIEQIKTDCMDEIIDIQDDTVSYIAQQKKELIQKFSDAEGLNGIRYKLHQIDANTYAIYENILAIVPDTEDEIEENIRAMIVDNGYVINTFNDGYGNVTVEITEVISNV